MHSAEWRPTQAKECYSGKYQEPIKCPNCGKQTAIRASAQSYEDDWVNKCWSCDFMWTHEDNELIK